MKKISKALQTSLLQVLSDSARQLNGPGHWDVSYDFNANKNLVIVNCGGKRGCQYDAIVKALSLQKPLLPTGLVYVDGQALSRSGREMDEKWTEDFKTYDEYTDSEFDGSIAYEIMPTVSNSVVVEESGSTKPSKAAKSVAPKKITKKQKATEIYVSNEGLSRGEMIEKFMSELDMTKAGASTYYANCKREASESSES